MCVCKNKFHTPNTRRQGDGKKEKPKGVRNKRELFLDQWIQSSGGSNKTRKQIKLAKLNLNRNGSDGTNNNNKPADK